MEGKCGLCESLVKNKNEGGVPSFFIRYKLFLAAEKSAENAFELVADIVDLVCDAVEVELYLDAVNDLFNLFVGKVDAEELFNCLDGIALEACEKVLVALYFFYEFFDLSLDIHYSFLSKLIV